MKDNDAEVLRPCALHGVDPKDDTYGPWMVVSRKKSSNRKDKKRDFAPTSAMHAMWHEGTDERGLGDMAKVTLGMVVLKINEGKRNANGELVGFGEPLEEQPGFKGKGISSDSPYKLGLFNQGTSKTYEGPSSIKGKKVLARLRAAPAHSRGAKPREGNKSNKLLKSIWTRTNAASQSNNDGKFQFLSKSRNSMDDTSEGKDSGNSSNGDRRHQSKSHPQNGVVQFRLKGGMEMDFSINTNECKVGQASVLRPSLGSNKESMVVLSNRCARERGGENVGLGEHPSNFLSSNTVCCRTGDEAFSKTNVGGSTYCNNLHGQSVCRENHPSVPTNHYLQLACQSRGEENGGIRALPNDDAWNRATNGISEENRMEFDGGGEASTSLR